MDTKRIKTRAEIERMLDKIILDMGAIKEALSRMRSKTKKQDWTNNYYSYKGFKEGIEWVLNR